MRSIQPTLVLLLVTVAACSAGETRSPSVTATVLSPVTNPETIAATTPDPTVATTSSATTSPVTMDLPACFPGDTDGCLMVALFFEDPFPLDDAMATLRSIPGTPIALWRTDFACVPREFSDPDEPLAASRFAYVDGDELAAGRRRAYEEGRTTITGLHIAEGFWARWTSEWAAAGEPGVLVEAVALFTPASVASGLGDDGRLRAVVEIEWRQIEDTGEIMVRDESGSDLPLRPAPAPDCPLIP